MKALEPRKLPQQRRSRATVEAILDACAEDVGRLGYHRLSTHRIAARAGVSVGTLYQYFPNREAVAGALAVRALERLLEALQRALAECVADALESLPATEHLLSSAMTVLVAERPVFARLAVEATHLFRLPAAADLRRRLMQLPQEIRLAGGERLDLPMPQDDAWLIGHMVSASLLQVSLMDATAERRNALTREIARLVCRMAVESGALAARAAA
jgi:AcrR family transcriptional regulator